MNYPKSFKFKPSKLYLYFFLAVGFLTFAVINIFLTQLLIQIALSMALFVTIIATVKRLQVKCEIVINTENIIINQAKVQEFRVVFINNIWGIIKYKQHGKKQVLIFFVDSFANNSINEFHKYINQ